MFSLAWRSMGRRCSKKAVRCGAIGVLPLACEGGNSSVASPDVAPSWDFLMVPRHPARRVLCRLLSLFPAVCDHGLALLPMANCSARSEMPRISSGTASRYQYVPATVL